MDACSAGGGGSGFIGGVINGTGKFSAGAYDGSLRYTGGNPGQGYAIITPTATIPGLHPPPPSTCAGGCNGSRLQLPASQLGQLLKRRGLPGDYGECCPGSGVVGFCDGANGAAITACAEAIGLLHLGLGYTGPELGCTAFNASGCVTTAVTAPATSCPLALAALWATVCEPAPPAPTPEPLYKCSTGHCQLAADRVGVPLGACATTCGATTKAYRCVANQCVVSTKGSASIAECSAACVPSVSGQ